MLTNKKQSLSSRNPVVLEARFNAAKTAQTGFNAPPDLVAATLFGFDEVVMRQPSRVHAAAGRGARDAPNRSATQTPVTALDIPRGWPGVVGASELSGLQTRNKAFHREAVCFYGK